MKAKNNHIVYHVYYNGKIVYIGSGKEGRENHVNSGHSHNPNLNKHYFTIGALDVRVIITCLTKDQALRREKIDIDCFYPEYNIKKQKEPKAYTNRITRGFGWLNRKEKSCS